MNKDYNHGHRHKFLLRYHLILKILDIIQQCCIIVLEVMLMTILELRQKTGLSQSKFANKFHLNVRTVQTWEQGTRKTPDYVVWLIEKVMDLEEQLDAQRN